MRITRDRRRLTEAALALVEDEAMPLTVEAISRQAGMSKATFYELWASIADFMPDLLLEIRCSAGSTPCGRVRHAAAEAGVALSTAQARRIARSLECARGPGTSCPVSDLV
jgi:AraC-like DNA-binding protein